MTITSRGKQVLQGIAAGLSNPQIGETLKLSHKTVDKHRQRLYRAFKVDNAVSLVLAALRAKEISL